jgi:hypothetical protein
MKNSVTHRKNEISHTPEIETSHETERNRSNLNEHDT